MVIRVRAIQILNEKAIALIRQQDFKLAMAHLREALAKIQNYVVEHNNNDDEHDDNNNGRTSCQIELHSSAPYSEISGHEDSSLTAFVLYDRCMSMQTAAAATQVDDNDVNNNNNTDDFRSPDNRSFWSAVILYNMALCFQLFALATGKDNLMNTSIRIYSVALGILSADDNNQQHAGGPQPDASKTVFKLAIVNNLGCIHYHFFNNAAADACVGQMSRILLDITNGGTQVVPGYLYFFFVNVLHNETQSTRASPSA